MHLFIIKCWNHHRFCPIIIDSLIGWRTKIQWCFIGIVYLVLEGSNYNLLRSNRILIDDYFWQNEVLTQREVMHLCIMCIHQPVLVWKQRCVIWQVAMLYILLSHLTGTPILLFKQSVNNSCSDSWKCPCVGPLKDVWVEFEFIICCFCLCNFEPLHLQHELSSCSAIICFRFIVNYR